MNHSPWIAQLNRTRPADTLSGPLGADVVIVGGGIAGITTAYMVLTKTNLSVVLIEAGKVAHGATGHNAGQITSYFEKPFKELVERYGLDRAAHAQKVIEEDARMLLDEIISGAQLQTPHSQFIGYNGFSTVEQILEVLADIKLKAEGGVRMRPFLIAHDWEYRDQISNDLLPYIEFTSAQNIRSLLDTNDSQYIAALPFLSGCMNSALFSEELAGFLIATFPERFTLKEHAPVSRIALDRDRIISRSGDHEIISKQIVLCTNGFESIAIENLVGTDIDTAFHHEIQGVVGYMGASVDHVFKGVFASIYTHEKVDMRNPYFYTTRRPFEQMGTTYGFTCIGGPERELPDRATYDPYHEYPLIMKDSIDTFSARTYQPHAVEMDYYWHGLMGYTKSGVRLIGREPKHTKLLYNLGCNGVGILTSIYGADRIAKLLRGDVLERTIFDPMHP